MTDLISTLADQILALIHSRLRSPTKAEIVDLLRKSQEDAHPVLLAAHPEDYLVSQAPKLVASSREKFEKLAANVFNAPFETAKASCSATTDGVHTWVYDITMDDYQCSCGARSA